MGQRPEKDARTPVSPNSANVGPNLESRNLIPLTRARTSCDLIARMTVRVKRSKDLIYIYKIIIY